MTQLRLPDLSDDTNGLINQLNDRLTGLGDRNARLDAFYDAENNLKRAHGGVIPEQYYRLGLVLGWSSKAVDALGRRCNLDGFRWPDGTLGDLGYRELWNGNRLGAETDQGITSSLIHGLSFVVASQGGDGEPAGLIHYYSASDATGVWDPRARRLENLFVVNDRDKQGEPTALTLYEDGKTTTAVLVNGGWEVRDVAEHAFGVPAAPLVYRPRLRKPMGRTRLTGPVRGLQNAGARALVRLEGHMDVYAYPEFWVLGAGLDVFQNADGTAMSAMQRLLGRMKGIPDDKDEEQAALARADVKKFDAASPEPHLAALNAYAKLFARETSLPDSAVAITDLSNPTSAESYDAAQYELIAEAEGAVGEWSPALETVVPIGLAMQNGLDEVPAEWASMSARWRDPRYLSRAAQADAGQKQLVAVPWLAETEVGLELLGLDADQIEDALGERRRQQSRANLGALVQAGQTAQGVDSAAEMKAKFDALGVAIRAGVKPEDAAARLGLQGTQFTGAVPVSLRVPEAQAPDLEER